MGLKGCVARKLRVRYPDALDYVINRGNYRSDVRAMGLSALDCGSGLGNSHLTAEFTDRER